MRDFDPRGALDGGPDGLAAYRAIAADARTAAGSGRARSLSRSARAKRDAVAALFAAAGFRDIAIAPDLAGMPRVVIGNAATHDRSAEWRREKAGKNHLDYPARPTTFRVTEST